MGGGVEVNAVNDALEEGIGVRDGAEVTGELLADLVRERADDGPNGVVGVLGRQREEEADELLVMLHELERPGPRADLLGHTVDLIIEYVAEALGEDERENEILVFRCVLGAADGTGGIPDPGFEGYVVALTAFHRQLAYWWLVAFAHTVHRRREATDGSADGSAFSFRAFSHRIVKERPSVPSPDWAQQNRDLCRRRRYPA